MSKLTCTVKHFDVSTGEAEQYVFHDVEDITTIKQSNEDGMLIITDNKTLIQIPSIKLISLVIE